MNGKLAEIYAKILLTMGINLQENQALAIFAPVEASSFTEILVQEAYKIGAADVDINWSSSICDAERLRYAKENSLYYIRPSVIKKYKEYIEEDRAIISLVSCRSPLFTGISSERTAKLQKATNQALPFYRKAIMNSDLQWLVAAVATPTWAEMLYPDKGAEALDYLWEQIFTVSRITNDNPVDHWKSHLNKLANIRHALSSLNLVSLHYASSNGTDLSIGLPDNHLWQSGAELSTKGVSFTANIPTEEVFTAPHFKKTNGVVYATRPLVAYNQLIQNIYLEFKEGKVIDYAASEGIEILSEILTADNGASYLGEVALVPKNSPISRIPYNFFETLIDENASCHLALGASYPSCVTGGENMSKEELLNAGLNHSDIHVDFMIGAEDTEIVGTTKDGKRIPVFENGLWADSLLINV